MIGQFHAAVALPDTPWVGIREREIVNCPFLDFPAHSPSHYSECAIFNKYAWLAYLILDNVQILSQIAERLYGWWVGVAQSL
jgi:hypothetical protein